MRCGWFKIWQNITLETLHKHKKKHKTQTFSLRCYLQREINRREYCGIVGVGRTGRGSECSKGSSFCGSFLWSVFIVSSQSNLANTLKGSFKDGSSDTKGKRETQSCESQLWTQTDLRSNQTSVMSLCVQNDRLTQSAVLLTPEASKAMIFYSKFALFSVVRYSCFSRQQLIFLAFLRKQDNFLWHPSFNSTAATPSVLQITAVTLTRL